MGERANKRKRTDTSAFGTPGRVSHDASRFYQSRLYEGLQADPGKSPRLESGCHPNEILVSGAGTTIPIAPRVSQVPKARLTPGIKSLTYAVCVVSLSSGCTSFYLPDPANVGTQRNCAIQTAVLLRCTPSFIAPGTDRGRYCPLR